MRDGSTQPDSPVLPENRTGGPIRVTAARIEAPESRLLRPDGAGRCFIRPELPPSERHSRCAFGLLALPDDVLAGIVERLAKLSPADR